MLCISFDYHDSYTHVLMCWIIAGQTAPKILGKGEYGDDHDLND